MKKSKVTRSLLTAVSVVALSAVMYGCVHSGGDSTPTLTKDEVTATGGATIKAGTTRLDGALADAFGGVSDDELDSLDREYATGETVTLAGYVLTCVSGPCRVTINANDTITTTGTIGVMAYVAPQPVDSDGDGVADDMDAFPDDPMETADSDGDGVGDNADAFPDDATETVDSDGDGVGDNADAFPDDATETVDSDGDGVGDNADAFPDDPSETADSDGDGIGDNADAYNVPNDSDNDGVPDVVDAFPDDPTETNDSDGDGVGDNADDFPKNAAETTDSDGDGVGDNADAFPNDASETADSDGDGVGDNADALPNNPHETADSDGDGVGDKAEVAGTMRTAITAEAAQGTDQNPDAGLGGSDRRNNDGNTSTLGDNPYELGIKRDRSGTTITIDVPGAANDDPKFAKAMDLGDGVTKHTRTMTADSKGNVVREEVMVSTDIAAPVVTPFAGSDSF